MNYCTSLVKHSLSSTTTNSTEPHLCEPLTTVWEVLNRVTSFQSGDSSLFFILPTAPTSLLSPGVGIGVGCGVGWATGPHFFGSPAMGYVGSGCGAGLIIGFTAAGVGLGKPEYGLWALPRKGNNWKRTPCTALHIQPLKRSLNCFCCLSSSAVTSLMDWWWQRSGG